MFMDDAPSTPDVLQADRESEIQLVVFALGIGPAAVHQDHSESHGLASRDVHLAYIERVAGSMPTEKQVPRLVVFLYASQAFWRRHIEHHDVRVVIRDNAFTIVVPNRLGPAFYHCANLDFLARAS